MIAVSSEIYENNFQGACNINKISLQIFMNFQTTNFIYFHSITRLECIHLSSYFIQQPAQRLS